MEENSVKRKYEVLVIGGSAGSLGVIFELLAFLRNRTFSVIVVLHRKESVDSILEHLLASKSDMDVKEAEEKEAILPSTVYLAPADYHLLIETDRTFSLDASEKVNYSRPSIDVTFESIASVYKESAIALLLSGGNNDGTEGLKNIREAGGLCIVQDPDSAEVRYMPEHALQNMRPHQVLAPKEMAGFLNSL